MFEILLWITDAKDKFLNRLSVTSHYQNISANPYWSVINNSLNNKIILTIPPLSFNTTLISDFKQKVNLFNSFFSLSRYTDW